MDTNKKNDTNNHPTDQTLKPMTNNTPATLSPTVPGAAASTAANQLSSKPSSPAMANHQQQNQISTSSPQPSKNNSGHAETSSIKSHPQKYVPTGGIANPQTQVKTRKETLEAKRERKAAKTLAIITGAFVVCWLPFFLTALILPLCGETCSINDNIASLFLWLGYFNSTLNPVIYTIFSPEFRQAFKRILFGTHRTGYYRGGKL